MFFTIPISTGKKLTALPIVTIALILINVLVWLIGNSIMNRQSEQMMDIRRQMWEYEQIYLGDFPLNSYKFLTFHMIRERDQLILDGEIIPLESDIYENWKSLHEQFEIMWENQFYKKYGFTPARFNILTIFTSIFIHLDIFHLIGNLLFLWLSGCNLEVDIGWKKYLGFYFFFGFASTFIHYLSNPSSELPTIGASGAIAGLMGAFLIRYYLTKIKFFYFIWLLRPMWGTFRIPAYICLPFWFIQQIIFSQSGADTGTAFWAHIGGFIVGAFVFFIVQMAHWLPEQDPESDDEDNYLQSSVKAVKKLKDKDIIIHNPTADNLPQLMAIVRAEPENTDAILALARLQFDLGAYQDCAISYNLAIDSVLSLNEISRISALFTEMKSKNLIKYVSKHNNIQLVLHLEKLKCYEDAVYMAILFIKKYPQDAERPKMIIKIYQICKTHLKDEIRARKAAALLKKDYPYLLQSSSRSS